VSYTDACAGTSPPNGSANNSPRRCTSCQSLEHQNSTEQSLYSGLSKVSTAYVSPITALGDRPACD